MISNLLKQALSRSISVPTPTRLAATQKRVHFVITIPDVRIRSQKKIIHQMSKKYRLSPDNDLLDDSGELNGCVELSTMDLANTNGDECREMLIEEKIEQDREMAKIRHWKESPYAVGLVEVNWSDELHRYRRRGRTDDLESNGANRPCCDDVCREEMEPTCGCLYASGLICSMLGAKRLGNMAVLKESTETVVEDDDENNDEMSSTRRVSRRKISIVVGPYWPMLVCITYPLIAVVSFWTAVKGIPGKHPLFILFWLICTVGLCASLFGVGCRDPGILPRARDPHLDWRWNDQGQTYRPRGAVYDPDCAVVVEKFDHTCPWTGTAIGKKNMASFQTFVCLVFFCLIMDIFLLTGASL